jgi:hypothetical protein
VVEFYLLRVYKTGCKSLPEGIAPTIVERTIAPQYFASAH